MHVANAELPGAGHWGRQPEKEVHQRHPHRFKVIPGSHQCEFLTFETAWFPGISSAILGFAENLFVSDFRGGPLGEGKDPVDPVKPVIEKHFSNYLWTFSISTRIQSQRTAQLMDHLFAIMIGEQFLICDLEKKLWGESQKLGHHRQEWRHKWSQKECLVKSCDEHSRWVAGGESYRKESE